MTENQGSAVESIVQELVAAVTQGEVVDGNGTVTEKQPAIAAYYAVVNGYRDYSPTIYENSPLLVLDELGTDVPSDWVDYCGDLEHSQMALEAMARRQLEEEVANRLENAGANAQ